MSWHRIWDRLGVRRGTLGEPSDGACTYKVAVGRFGLDIAVGALPLDYDWLTKDALLVEEIDMKPGGGRVLFVGVHDYERAGHTARKPILTVAQTYTPWMAGFDPGILIVPETERLFVGAGTRLLGYDLKAPARLWEDQTDCGFWRWGRHQDWVWMAAELEFAVWSKTGEKLWSTFVEPPWDLTSVEGVVELDVMGVKMRRRLSDGAPL
ncbi:MAG: hypothetical protein K8S25_15045 [Alphaproteobacteria bacterium]|nr:hypothetical protein [Alphaproteobacteria bacterium]